MSDVGTKTRIVDVQVEERDERGGTDECVAQDLHRDPPEE
jgi:hypothetical protein